MKSVRILLLVLLSGVLFLTIFRSKSFFGITADQSTDDANDGNDDIDIAGRGKSRITQSNCASHAGRCGGYQCEWKYSEASKKNRCYCTGMTNSGKTDTWTVSWTC